MTKLLLSRVLIGCLLLFTGMAQVGAQCVGPMSVPLSGSSTGLALSATTTVQAVNCALQSNGSATAHPAGGSTPYSYHWSTGTNLVTASNLVAGTYTVTVSDGKGCMTTATAVVTQPTTLIASATAGAVLCNGNTASVMVSAMGGTSGYSGTGTFTVGVGTFTYTVTDAHGCTATTSATVSYADTSPPMITCPPSLTVNCSASFCGANVTVGVASATDNCSVSSLVNDKTGTGNATGNYNIGTTVVKWTAKDAVGNSSTCNMSVKVVDNRIPNITCPANQTRIGNPASVTLPPPTVMNDNCTVAEWDGRYKFGTSWTPWVAASTGFVPGATPTPGACPLNGSYSPGAYTVQYQVIDASGNLKVCQFSLSVTASLQSDPGAARTTTDAQPMGKEEPAVEPYLNEYPNPFTDEINISFGIQRSANVRLSVTDITGREIELLANAHIQAGDYTYTFHGENISAGVYFVRLQVDEQVKIAKMVKL